MLFQPSYALGEPHLRKRVFGWLTYPSCGRSCGQPNCHYLKVSTVRGIAARRTLTRHVREEN
jgi:hypothetical protein